MTLAELVAETRPDNNLDLIMEYDAVQDQLMELEERLESIEASLLTRGFDIVTTY